MTVRQLYTGPDRWCGAVSASDVLCNSRCSVALFRIIEHLLVIHAGQRAGYVCDPASRCSLARPRHLICMHDNATHLATPLTPPYTTRRRRCRRRLVFYHLYLFNTAAVIFFFVASLTGCRVSFWTHVKCDRDLGGSAPWFSFSHPCWTASLLYRVGWKLE